jgi:hypothetical protein
LKCKTLWSAIPKPEMRNQAALFTEIFLFEIQTLWSAIPKPEMRYQAALFTEIFFVKLKV